MLPRWLQTKGFISDQTIQDDAVGLMSAAEHENEVDESIKASKPELLLPTGSRRLTQSLSIVVRLLGLLTPRIFSKPKERRLHDTSFLDGLRGVAALFVVLYHATLPFYPTVRQGYMSSETATNILGAPILRIWLSGPAMVDVFFIISGYVLSAKALKLSRQEQVEQAYETIASSVFRRGARIYIPCFFSTFISGVFQQMGFLNGEPFRPYPPAPSWADQFYLWWHSTLDYISPFDMTGHVFEQATWTIPIEFKGSLLVFLTCLGLARSSSLFRFSFLMLMAMFLLWHQWMFLFTFAAGMVCADIAIALKARQAKTQTPASVLANVATGTLTVNGDVQFYQDSGPYYDSPKTEVCTPPAAANSLEFAELPISITDAHRHSSTLSGVPHVLSNILHQGCYFLLFLLSIYLISLPTPQDSPSTTPGYQTLYNILTPASWRAVGAPTHQLWPNIGAVLLVLTLDQAGPQSIYQAIFTNRFAQYLGDISFSLYLLHSMVLYGFSSHVIRGLCDVVGCGVGDIGGEGWGRGIVLLMTILITAPVLAWASEVFTTLVDDNAIRWARMMRKW